jgi:XTP/dITP diphosphohydrolase
MTGGAGGGEAGAILLATSNPGKIREIARLLEPFGWSVVTLADCGITPTYEEKGATYDANARGKAKHFAALAGRAAIADDSGLEVEALGGKPGVQSARYGGPGKDDAARCRLLLDALAGVPDGKRAARYVAVAAIARPDGETRLFHGACEGRIIREMRGTGGFGYDPIFHYPTFGATFAAVEDERKRAVSHRGKALRALALFLAGDEGRAFLRGSGRAKSKA